MTIPEPLISRRQLAKQLRTSPEQIDRMTADGLPVAGRTPAGWAQYLRSQVNEYLAERARLAARGPGQ